MNLYFVHANQTYATDGASYKTFAVIAESEERARVVIEGRFDVLRVDLALEGVRDTPATVVCWAGGPNSLVE